MGPIAVVQPAEAVFVRGDEQRSTGPLARTEDEFVQPDRPTALVAIVCRDRPRKLAVEVERRLEGETAVGFRRWPWNRARSAASCSATSSPRA